MRRTRPPSRGSLLLAGILVVSAPCLGQNGEAQDPYQPGISSQAVLELRAARSLRRQQEYDRAIEALQVLTRAEPQYYLAQYNLGLAYADSGDYEKAIQTLQEARAIREREEIEEATIYNSIGWVHLLRGDYGPAEKSFQQALAEGEQLDADSHLRVLNNLGLLYLYSGRFGKAQVTLESAVEQFGSETASRSLELLEMVRKQTGSEEPPE